MYDARDLKEHVDLSLVRTALSEAVHHLHHPGGALTTRGALATRFVFVELVEGT